MRTRCTLGVDIGTSSTKGVLVAENGEILAEAARTHDVQRPHEGWVEMDGRLWWDEFTALSRELLSAAGDDIDLIGVGVSGMGPCVLLADAHDEPVRPAILYGVDTRAGAQITRIRAELGDDEITRVGGSMLSAQAAGPKIAWVADAEPEVYARARRLFMPASWLVRRLTGAYVLDHQSASQTTPLYDIEAGTWHESWWRTYAPGIEPPALRWAGEIAGTVTDEAAEVTGIRPGTPVITGTIDAWSEAVSVGAHEPGDLMLMYGTTMFLIATGIRTLRTPSMWTTVGAFAGSRNLAGGLATSGAITSWLKDLVDADYPTLLAEAAASGAGARGLVMLPYFAGERTPIPDPDARGVIAGLTLSHGRGDLYRAALEATALGVRHNIETMRAAGADIRRIVAVGGGTQGRLWMQIVSDATGLAQQVPRTTIGASYGAAFLAATATTARSVRIDEWNPIVETIEPDPAAMAAYDDLFDRYLRLYDGTRDVVHALAAAQRAEDGTPAAARRGADSDPDRRGGRDRPGPGGVRMTRRTPGIPHTAERAAFPLGGIGTGNVSLGARGELRDWELENLPDKGRLNPYTFFAIHAVPVEGAPVTRVLEARLTGRHDWDAGYGFDRLAGLPRLDAATLHGEYPVVDIDFTDEVLPVEVSLHAFTPLVPLDPDASGIPAAVLRYRVTNPAATPVTVTVAGSLTHTAGRGDGPFGMRAPQTVRWREDMDAGVRGLDFGIDLPVDDPGYGTMSLTTTDAATTVKPQWVTGFWPDGPRLFWNDLTEDGLLEPEPRLTLEDRPRGLFADSAPDDEPMSEADLFARLPRLRTGSLGIVHELAPGQSRDFEFVLAWSFPNRRRAWQGHIIFDDPHAAQIVRNRYAALWPDAWAAASHLHRELPALEAQTDAFVEALYGGSVDPVIAQAVGANIAAARSTTCFVVDTPNPALGQGPVFVAWEGSFDHGGSCEGTCTHVWSYAQTVGWLFPSLERSARRVEYLLETDAAGAQKFRSNRVFGAPGWFMGPAVDGQLGTFLRLHREWRFSGDDHFLRELWPAAARTLDYAIREWDRDGDGLLDGELHNTYDIEFFGIDPLANGMFLAALRAGQRIAAHLGDADRADRWRAAADRAAAGMDRVLWNGEYYRQVIDDIDAHRYQYGDGVLSDQLLGQFHAYLAGLGDLLPRDRLRSALHAIVRHNFRADLRHHESTQRTYALNDEGGLLLASWPRGGRPAIPFVYSDEVWTGIEHQVAATLVYAGMIDEALTIERTRAARYDGTTRNPWNEIECGNHYARSLSSWALLLAFTGAQWDGPSRTLAFAPADDRVHALFTTGNAWGRVHIDGDEIALHIDGGVLDLDRLVLRGRTVASTPTTLAAGDSLRAHTEPRRQETP